MQVVNSQYRYPFQHTATPVCHCPCSLLTGRADTELQVIRVSERAVNGYAKYPSRYMARCVAPIDEPTARSTAPLPAPRRCPPRCRTSDVAVELQGVLHGGPVLAHRGAKGGCLRFLWRIDARGRRGSTDIFCPLASPFGAAPAMRCHTRWSRDAFE